MTPRVITVPTGTEIRVRLVDAVGSARSHSGERFLATLDAPVIVNDWVAVPRGVNVTGKVVAAQLYGGQNTPAELVITLTALELGGQSYEIKTSNYSQPGRAHSLKDAEWIRGSAAAGAAKRYAVGKGEILLPAESRLRFTLQQPLVFVKTG